MAFQAVSRQSTARLQISSALLHLQLPLGDNQDNNSNPMLEGGCGTMYGANVGNITYCRSLARKYPYLLTQFKALADLADQKQFNIRGIGDDTNEEASGGTLITHTISYKTPFFIEGQQVLVMIGLGDISTDTCGNT
eukprot:12918816-Ditylum_brightwellii.AAC.1